MAEGNMLEIYTIMVGEQRSKCNM